MLKTELIETLDDVSSIVEDEDLSAEEKISQLEDVLFEDEETEEGD